MNDDIRTNEAIEELVAELERPPHGRAQGWAEALPPRDMVGKDKVPNQ